jgi:hypothetical protein
MLSFWVSYWCYQQMLHQTEKLLLLTNTLAYLASLSVTKEKSFITLTPGKNVIKLFILLVYECSQ